MMRAIVVVVRRMAALVPVLLLGLSACSSVPGTSSNGLPDSPLFPSDSLELARYEKTIQGRDHAWPVCDGAGACASAHFTRALVALYRNQAEAASHFQAVVEQAPDTPKADASRVWLRLLSANAYVERPRLFPRAAEQLVRQYLVAELRDRERIQALERAVHTLERDLATRTREVEKLTGQLEALKRIDREIEALRDKNRLPAPAEPAPSEGLPEP